jgi:hypothetical protein
MASSELGSFVDIELTSLGINTNAEVHTFRIPGERRGSSQLKAVLVSLQAALKRQWISRKRVRHDALRLLREGAL